MENQGEVDSQLPEAVVPTAFDRLPNEILLKIIGYLSEGRSRPGKSKQNYSQMIDQTITLISNYNSDDGYADPDYVDTWSLCIYKYKPEFPNLNSIQSFSIVNHKTYSVCRPLLWQVSLTLVHLMLLKTD